MNLLSKRFVMKLLVNFHQKWVQAPIGFAVFKKPVVAEVAVLMDNKTVAEVAEIKDVEEVNVVVVEEVVVNQDKVADNVIMEILHLIIILALAVAIL